MDNLIIFCAKYVFFAAEILVLLLLLQQNRKQRLQFLLTLISAGIVALALSKILGKLYYDPRPFVNQNIAPLIAHAPDNGFPSEHTWFTATVASCLYLFNKQYGKLAFIVVLVVGIARVLAHLHSPIDIVGGIAVGITATYMAKLLLPKVSKSLFARPKAD